MQAHPKTKSMCWVDLGKKMPELDLGGMQPERASQDPPSPWVLFLSSDDFIELKCIKRRHLSNFLKCTSV